MLKRTLYSEGNDIFEDNVFATEKWSAPHLIAPEEIENSIKEFDLIGGKITGLRFIGMCYNLRVEDIESIAYDSMEGVGEEERQYLSDYRRIRGNTLLQRVALIDEPLIITYEKGNEENTIELLCPQVSEFRLSKNKLPYHIEAGVNMWNVDAEVLFSPCLNKTIIDVGIQQYRTKYDPMCPDCFIDENGTEYALVSAVFIKLSNGYEIKLGGLYDYCVVECVLTAEGKTADVRFDELLQGLYNIEDIHYDELTKFMANSSTVLFGKKGAYYSKAPAMKLCSSGSDSKLYLNEWDFILFRFSITNYTQEAFDEFEHYHFSYYEWMGKRQVEYY